MKIELFVPNRSVAKRIDNFIYERLNGLFYTYESHIYDSEEDPNLVVDVNEKVEIDSLALALVIYEEILKIDEDIKTKVQINDVSIASFFLDQ